MKHKIDTWMETQKEADERIEKLKEQERIRDILRKEFIIFNNQTSSTTKRDSKGK